MVKEVVPLIEAEKIAEAIKVLIKESKTLLEAPEKGNAMQMTHTWLNAICLEVTLLTPFFLNLFYFYLVL